MQLPGLTSLRLGNNCLDDAGMPWACLAASALPARMHLDLDSNLLTMVGGMEGGVGGGETTALLPTDALPALTHLQGGGAAKVLSPSPSAPPPDPRKGVHVLAITSAPRSVCGPPPLPAIPGRGMGGTSGFLV